MVLMRSLASALAPQRRAARAVSTLGGSSSYSSGDGRRAAPRGAVWLGAAALGGAAYEAQESACAGGRVRVVTYNVLFGSVEKEQVMVIHSVLAAERAKRVAAGRPYVLCGDFNVKPYDASYALLTSGALGEAFAAYAPPPQADVAPARAFAPVLEPPLTSAYAAATGAEPDFTNFAYTKPMGGERDAFVETLDYIFCSAGQWKVAGVKELRSKHGLDTSKPYPTADEPSDHVMLAADLELV
ncbi:hypothetical protein SO694_00007688 [Aureococcus anophagefferens]|uniref:Endonuclease/exonuclease/phosphatase domain-containing protein n=1 Tax=Aureococcus anophagefferens TaxID=44056 RepID=A0ABR1GB61_AURAN